MNYENREEVIVVANHLRFLLNCEAGRWLLSTLMEKSHQFGPLPFYDGGVAEGKYQLVESTITTPILKLLGPDALAQLDLKNVKGRT